MFHFWIEPDAWAPARNNVAGEGFLRPILVGFQGPRSEKQPLVGGLFFRSVSRVSGRNIGRFYTWQNT